MFLWESNKSRLAGLVSRLSWPGCGWRFLCPVHPFCVCEGWLDREADSQKFSAMDLSRGSSRAHMGFVPDRTVVQICDE